MTRLESQTIYSRQDLEDLAACVGNGARLCGARKPGRGSTTTICIGGDTLSPVRSFVYAGDGVYLDFNSGHLLKSKSWNQLVQDGVIESSRWDVGFEVWARVVESLEGVESCQAS